MFALMPQNLHSRLFACKAIFSIIPRRGLDEMGKGQKTPENGIFSSCRFQGASERLSSIY